MSENMEPDVPSDFDATCSTPAQNTSIQGASNCPITFGGSSGSTYNYYTTNNVLVPSMYIQDASVDDSKELMDDVTSLSGGLSSQANRSDIIRCIKEELRNIFPKGARSVVGVGRGNWKDDSLEKHVEFSSHKLAAEGHRAKVAPGVTTLARAARVMDLDHHANMKKLFNTAAYVAKKERPYSDFPDLVKLQERNGNPMGSTYQYCNDKAFNDFIHYIAADLRDKKVKFPLLASPVCSILLDSSVDMSNSENANFYVRFFDAQNLVAKTEYLGTEKMSATGTASWHQCVKNILQRFTNGNEIYNKIISLGSDGASTMMGLKARMKNDISDIIVVHCVAHNLQLAIGDACKGVSYLKDKFQPTVSYICRFYTASARRENPLIALSKSLEECFLKIPFVRWVASGAVTLKAIINDWVALTRHLEELVNRNRSVANEGVIAKGLGHLKSSRFIQTLHFMCDLLHALKALSMKFQRDDLYISDIPPLVLECIDGIKNMAETDTPGGFLSRLKFEKDPKDPQHEYFHGVKLIDPRLARDAGSTQPSFEKDRITIVYSTVAYLQKRFKSLLDSTVVKAASVFDPSTWPDTKNEFLKYGNSDMQVIGEHFFERLRRLDIFQADSDDESGCEGICTTQNVVVATLGKEWMRFKKRKCKRHLMSGGKTLTSFLTCAHAILKYPALFPTLGYVVKIIMVLPTSTACCERGFSALNRIKTKRRACLVGESLEDCLTASILLPPLDDYDADGAVDAWVKGSKRPLCGRQNAPKAKRPRKYATERGAGDSVDIIDSDSESTSE